MFERKTRWTAAAIKELRDRRRETQAQFARHFLLGGETIRKWEKDQPPSGPAIVVLEALERDTNGELPLLDLSGDPSPDAPAAQSA